MSLLISKRPEIIIPHWNDFNWIAKSSPNFQDKLCEKVVGNCYFKKEIYIFQKN